jgi:cell wall-associated NlpC family hydrolase
MSLPFFSSPERIAFLDKAAVGWLGTPFRAHNRARGPRGGVDCGNLIQELMLEAGFLAARLDLPRPPTDYGQHNAASLVCGFLETHPALTGRIAKLTDPDDLASPQPGDILGIRVGRCVHHLCIALDGGRFVQALKPHGVTIQPIAEISSRIEVIYRPIA